MNSIDTGITTHHREMDTINTPLLPEQYDVLPNVRFNRLPFFDIVSELIRPVWLVSQNTEKTQERLFYLYLTPAQASVIACSRDIRYGEYRNQIQVRFCLLETAREQEDFFPPNVEVKVNNKICPLPYPVPGPVDITPLIKLSPTVPNMIHVSWSADYVDAYAVTVTLVHKRDSQDLLEKLKAKSTKHSDYTKSLIKRIINMDADSENATTSLSVSLMCPIGKMRMITPCRATTCLHLQCFDASLFLQTNENDSTWNCPECNKPAKYDNLFIDEYFQKVLNSPFLSPESNEIHLHKDGSWSTDSLVENPPLSMMKVQKSEDDKSNTKIGEPVVLDSTLVNAGKTENIVDLTLSDSDDLTLSNSDDLTLAKNPPLLMTKVQKSEDDESNTKIGESVVLGSTLVNADNTKNIIDLSDSDDLTLSDSDDLRLSDSDDLTLSDSDDDKPLPGGIKI